MKNKIIFLESIFTATILICIFFAYRPSLFNGFTCWDDNIYVVENETIRDLSWTSLKTIFTTDVSLNYTPLTSLSFAGEYHFFKYTPFFYHLDNLLLHLAVVALVFIFTLRLSLSLPVSMLAALVFGLHPMHVESVAWVTERKDVLYAFFYMLALIFYWDYLRKKRKIFYALSLLCGFLSILAKPMALSLPLVLFVLDWFYGRKFEKKLLFEKIPFGLVIFPIAWLTYNLNARIIDLKFPDAVLTWGWTLTFYLKKFFFPFDFLPLYELPFPVKLSNLQFAGAFIIFIFIIVSLIYFRKNRWLAFSFLFYFTSIFFLLRFDKSADLCIVADRFMYLPSVGFCILLGVLAGRLFAWAKNQNLFYAVGLMAITLGCLYWLASATYQQCKIWGDGVAFWNKVLKHYPLSAMAYNQRALAYKEHGDLEKALADYTQAIVLLPNYDFALTNRGIVYKQMGKFQQAYNDHSQAIAVNPDFSEAYLNRGNVLFSAGDFKSALADYSKAIGTIGVSARRKSTIYQAETYSRRGCAYFFMKDYENALGDFNKTLEINPDNIVALDNRAIIFSIQGQKDKALADFERSLKLAPKNVVNYVNRAQLYYQSDDKKSALEDIQKALVLDPKYKRALELKSLIEKR